MEGRVRIYQVRAWCRPAAQGLLEDVQHLRAYGVRHCRYAVPQCEVQRPKGLFSSVSRWRPPPRAYWQAIWGYTSGSPKRPTAFFTHQVREAMKSSGNHPMDGTVHIYEFVVGGREQGKVGRSYDSKKKKAVCAVQLTGDGKVRRMYSMKSDNFSGKELKKMFDAHIDGDAKVTTDIWRGYWPLAKKYDIEQIPSNGGLNFKALHTMIHQIKSWIRTTYSWVSDFNVDRYFDEFCYRLNRSQSKGTIFNNLIVRMVKADKFIRKKSYAANY